jgi:hypothetical protein
MDKSKYEVGDAVLFLDNKAGVIEAIEDYDDLGRIYTITRTWVVDESEIQDPPE